MCLGRHGFWWLLLLFGGPSRPKLHLFHWQIAMRQPKSRYIFWSNIWCSKVLRRFQHLEHSKLVLHLLRGHHSCKRDQSRFPSVTVPSSQYPNSKGVSFAWFTVRGHLRVRANQSEWLGTTGDNWRALKKRERPRGYPAGDGWIRTTCDPASTKFRTEYSLRRGSHQNGRTDISNWQLHRFDRHATSD